MNKRAIIKKIIAKLVGELEIYFRAAQFSRAEATHESSKAENKYDTRGLEASYLARGQSKQAAEIEAAIAEFEKHAREQIWRGRTHRPRRAGGTGAGRRKIYFTSSARAPAAPEILHDQKEILVITPQSPLGEQLMGKKSGRQSATQPRRIETNGENFASDLIVSGW